MQNIDFLHWGSTADELVFIKYVVLTRCQVAESLAVNYLLMDGLALLILSCCFFLSELALLLLLKVE